MKKPNASPEKKPAADMVSRAPAAVPAEAAAERGDAAAKGHFEIQVAAHQDEKKAEQIAQKLKPLGFASRVAAKEIPGKGKWFRVIVGGFETRGKAKAAADRIDTKLRGVKCVVRSSGKE